MTGVAGALEQHVLGFPGWGPLGLGTQSYRAPAMGRHGKVSPGPGRLSRAPLAVRDCYPAGWYSSLGNGDKAGMGMGQDQEPDSVLLTMIN